MIKCKYCGAEIFDNSKFCLKCGKGIGGETNPSVKAETQKKFKTELMNVLKRYGHYHEREKNDSTYIMYAEEKDELKDMRAPVDVVKSMTLAVTCIMTAIFSVLIPGLNIENENFHWIVQNPTMSLYFCSALGFISTYALYRFLRMINDDEGRALFGFGDIIISIIIGAVASIASIFVLFFMKGFFGKGLTVVCIILTVILVIIAAFQIIFYAADSNYRNYVYGRKKRTVDELKASYEKKRDDEIQAIKKKYSDILSEKELTDCIESAKLQSATKFLEDINKNIKQFGGRN